MKLESYIKVYDNVMPLKTVGSILKYITIKNFKEFEEVGLGQNNFIDKNIRNVKSFDWNNWDNNSKTKIHWSNYLLFLFKQYFNEYHKEFANQYILGLESLSMECLKYEVGGHYVPHIDHHGKTPRTLSAILILNDDYEGGELEFCDPTTSKISVKVEKQSARLIIWPSCFLYPHGIKPITKGIRYSIVSWAS